MKTDPFPLPSAFLDVFRDLVRAYQPRALEPETARVYWETLGAFPIDVLRASALTLRRRSSAFFPTAPEWYAAAARHPKPRALACVVCLGEGLMRVEYRSGDPFDVAICACRIGQVFRRIGEAGIRQRLQLTDDHQIGNLEDFDEADV